MKNLNEILEEHVSRLENEPLTEVLNHIDEKDGNLTELITLAAEVKKLPPVKIDPVRASKQDEIIHSFISNLSRQTDNKKPVNIWDWLFDFTKPFTRVRWVVLVVSFLFTGFLFFTSVNQITSAKIRITELNGQVEIIDPKRNSDWILLNVDDEIGSGQKVRTGSNSSIEFKLPDQSFVRLNEDTEITIDKFSSSKNDGMTFVITQQMGSSHHQVTVNENKPSNYVVKTPSNQINVHGTNFYVNVAKNGKTYVQVDEGLVNVIGAGKQITITPGFAIETLPGETPSTPLHTFSSYGEVLKQEGNIWEMDDTLIFVSDETIVSRKIEPGEYVGITGRILPNGNWLADRIDKVESNGYQASFTGNIQFISEALWVVDDKSITVTPETIKPDHLSVGDLVRVVYVNQVEQRRKAIKIDILSYTGIQQKTNQNSMGENGSDLYGLSFGEDQLVIEECSLQYNLTGDLVNESENQENKVRNTTIDYQIMVGKKYVQQVILEPTYWDDIPAGEIRHFSIQINLTDEWLSNESSLPIKLKVRINKNNTNANSSDGLMIVVKKSCDSNPPETKDQSTSEGEGSQSEQAPPPEKKDLSINTSCVGVVTHPEGQKLANLYNATYDEIMTWFCDGFGFGEIDLAYFYSQKAQVSVDSIFEMVRNGLEWGEIITQLGLES